MLRIKKVKAIKDKIHIEYEVSRPEDKFDEYSLTCQEEAGPLFYAALRDLRRFVVEICEFPTGWTDTRILVNGVSFSYSGANYTMGAVIIAQLTLVQSNAKLNINTPHKIEEFYHGETGDDNQLLPDDCVSLLYELTSECQKYIEGSRAQTKMFDKEKAAV